MAILKIRDADGNVQEILAIKGEDGKDGTDGKDGLNGMDGTNGKDGADGKSAYDLAKESGFSGTLDEWLASLVGEDGKDGSNGTNGKDGNDYVLTEADKQEIAELVIQTANIAYVGTGTPASTLGNDGDIYIVTE